MATVGLIFPPNQPPERLRDVARATDAEALDALWVWEDCFAESGIAASAIALGATERIQVGLGLMPTPFRNVALTAMEVATIARVFPGRFVPGIGHGVLDWMGQIGGRVRSPLTLLDEQARALRALLHGERVTTAGRYVKLDDVALAWPPEVVPPLLIGGRGPKTLALAGRVADGIILDDGIPDATIAGAASAAVQAHAEAGRSDPLEIVAFTGMPIDATTAELEAHLDETIASGATTVAVCAKDANGVPSGGPEILRFAARLGAARLAVDRDR